MISSSLDKRFSRWWFMTQDDTEISFISKNTSFLHYFSFHHSTGKKSFLLPWTRQLSVNEQLTRGCLSIDQFICLDIYTCINTHMYIYVSLVHASMTSIFVSYHNNRYSFVLSLSLWFHFFPLLYVTTSSHYDHFHPLWQYCICFFF